MQAWQVTSSAPGGGALAEDGAAISRPGYSAHGWYVAPPRSTVMAALLANGLHRGIEHGRAMDSVDRAAFEVPWWYRTTFDTRGAGRTAVRLDGLLHKADVWVNGEQVAAAEQTEGAYTVSTFDVSALVGEGVNGLALRVHPGSPQENLSISWVDWAQSPPDHNMGIWRDVVIERTGDVRLGPPAVRVDLDVPGLAFADVEVSLTVSNLSHQDTTVCIRGLVSGHGAGVPLSAELTLGAGAASSISFGPQPPAAGDGSFIVTPGLRLARPQVWWPAGEGAQPLYDVEISASVNGFVSDQRSTTFGARSVTSYIATGDGRRFVVNGRELQVLAAGWAPDLFLRYDYQRLVTELGYALDLGLNTIRLEGKLENPEFFELADALGIMVLPGWECCSKWELEKREPGKTWSEHDFIVAERQAASEAVLLRNHPCVIGFLIGSDFSPPPRAASLYVRALRANGWALPIISSATAEGTDAAGPSGMKMTGPYSYVPPVYWYSTHKDKGGAVGFNSETSAGNTIPRLDSLRRMLSERELSDLWSAPEAKQYHAGPPSDFDNLAVFHRALAGRYGPVRSLEDFIRKAQLANYEVTRAQFEAYISRAFSDAPATGVVYWMFNSPWPSLNWQLYDWYLKPAGAYFGAKKANEALHPLYAYDTGTVKVANRRPRASGPLALTLEVRTLDGTLLHWAEHDVPEIDGPQVVDVAEVAVPEGMTSATYFLSLVLAGEEGKLLSRNVYWLSSQVDVLDWDNGPWFHTPLAQYADLTGLQDLPAANIEADVRAGPAEDGRRTARVTVRNLDPEGAPALGLHLSVLAPAMSGGLEAAEVVPTRWSDNDVTLFGGEEMELLATYPVMPGSTETFELDGFNMATPEDVRVQRDGSLPRVANPH